MKLFGNALTAQRQPMLANAALAIAFGATIGLDLLLIPRYGGVGAAWASTLAYTAGGIAVAVIFSRALRVREPTSFRAPAISAGCRRASARADGLD